MRITLISTGEEVLRGEILDSNAAHMAGALADRGFSLGRRFTCGDDQAGLVQTIRQALEDGEVVIGSGGLGPTVDDRTLDALAEVLDVPLDSDPGMLERLQMIFGARGFPYTDNQARQARLPRGARFLDNPVGTAPGIVTVFKDKPIFWLPGPPMELAPMLENEVLPRLEKQRQERGERLHAAARTLNVFGRGEGWIEDRLGAIERELPGLALGFRAALPEIQIKLRAAGDDPTRVEGIVAQAEQKVRERLGDVVFSDGEPLPTLVLRLLIERRLTLAAAESCTGGLLGKMLTDIPGSSAAFVLSAVTYANDMKERLLGVPREILETDGAVSEACARAMAEGVRRLAGANLAVAITGVAGPDGGSFEKPVGLVFFALCHPAGTETVVRKFRGRQRDAVRALAAFTSLDLIRRHLLGLPPLGPPGDRPAELSR